MSNPIITSPEDGINVLLQGFDRRTIGLQEQFVVLYLNRCNNVLCLYKASVGGITGTVVDLRLILSVAQKVAAVSMIIAHNHPSGNINPSNADKEFTRRIREAATLMDIKLLDHFIVTPEEKYFSFAEEGII